MSRGQSNESPTVVNFGFRDRSRYFLEIAPQLSSRGWVYSVPDPLLLRKKNLVAPGFEPGSLDKYPGTLTTRPHRRSIWNVKCLILYCSILLNIIYYSTNVTDSPSHAQGFCSLDTQHNRKRHPAPWNTWARRWDYTSNIRTTKRKQSSFHRQF
jgi:hypothetical protein